MLPIVKRKTGAQRVRKPLVKPVVKSKKKIKTSTDKSIKNSNKGTGNSANNQTVTINIKTQPNSNDSNDSAKKKDVEDKLKAAGDKLKKVFKEFNQAKQAAATAKVVIPKSISEIKITESSVKTVEQITALITDLESRIVKIKALMPKTASSTASSTTGAARSATTGIVPSNIYSTDGVQQLSLVAGQKPIVPLVSQVPVIKKPVLRPPPQHPALSDTTVDNELNNLESQIDGTQLDVSQLTADELATQAAASLIDSGSSPATGITVSNEFRSKMIFFNNEIDKAEVKFKNDNDGFNIAYAGIGQALLEYSNSLSDTEEIRIAKQLYDIIQQNESLGLTAVEVASQPSLPVFQYGGEADLTYNEQLEIGGGLTPPPPGNTTEVIAIPQYPEIETRDRVIDYRHNVFTFMSTDKFNNISPMLKDLLLTEYNMASQFLADEQPSDDDVEYLMVLTKRQLIDLAINAETPNADGLNPSRSSWKKLTKQAIITLILANANKQQNDTDMTLVM